VPSESEQENGEEDIDTCTCCLFDDKDDILDYEEELDVSMEPEELLDRMLILAATSAHTSRGSQSRRCCSASRTKYSSGNRRKTMKILHEHYYKSL
jgi:hypothetical protein